MKSHASADQTMFRASTFRALCVGFVVVFALASGAVGVSTVRDRSIAIDDGVRDAHNVAIVLGGQIARSIQSIDIVLRELQRRVGELDLEIASGAVRLPDLPALRDKLLQELAALPQAQHIGVSDQHGQFVLSTTAWPTPDINIGDRRYFKDLVANDDDRLGISMPVTSRFTGESTIVLARRLNGPGHAFLGIISIAVTRSYFENVYGALNSLPHQTFSLLRRDGTVLLRYPDSRDHAGEKIPPGWPFHAAVRAGGGSFRSTGMFAPSVERWIAAVPLTEYPLVVSISVPEDILLQGWRARTASTLIGTLAFLACALVLLWIMARQYRRLSASQAILVEQSQVLEHERALLQRNKTELDAALNNMNQGLAMFDGEARLVVCNQRYRDMHRLPVEQTAPGRPLRDIVAYRHRHCGIPPDVDAYMADIALHVSARASRTYEVAGIDGRILSIRNEPMPGGGWVATFEDVTSQRTGEAKIKWLAHSDLLTGIANRPHFLEQIEQARERLRADGQPFNVLMLDLDRFKSVNDSLGHAAGDLLLKEAARRLSTALRRRDTLARLGGDEFAIVQTPPRGFENGPGAMPAMRESAIVLANRIIDVIGRPYDVGGHKIVIGASIGIAMAPDDGAEPDELLKKADLALYRTKSEGRNGYSFFDQEMAATANERHQLEEDLRAGLSRHEFELHYQPLIDVASGEARGMEALVRWRHPTRGLVPPDRFISIAEDTGLIIPLGDWILQTACAEAAAWPPSVNVAINISAVQFRKTNLLDVILCALVDANLPPERLEVEITERVLLDNDADYLSTLHQLKNLGVAIVLDDFGTGYSSLGYLRMFPFDKIKIDRSFTGDMLERPECAAIVCAVVNLGRSLDIVTLAEGVETPAQLQALRATGVTQVQGYLFGRPAPAAAIVFDADSAPAALSAG